MPIAHFQKGFIKEETQEKLKMFVGDNGQRTSLDEYLVKRNLKHA